MYKIIEKQNNSGTFYQVQTYDSQNKLVDNKSVQISAYSTKTDDGIPLTMIYNHHMQPISDAIRFINFGGMKDQSQNYILQSISALKFFYSYLTIYNIELQDMKKQEAIGLIDFLKGISRQGLVYNTELTTKRSNETVSSYLKAIRKYISYLGYENHPLLERGRESKTIIMPESDGAKTIQTYDVNVKTSNSDAYVPAYISLSDYKDILNACAATKTPLRDRVICRLLFEHGLRIGEVFGLTLEDIKTKELDDFQVQYRLELRNRLSDTNEQNAKSVMNVTSAETYKDPNYRKKGIGYQVIIISEDLAMDLLEYINTAHSTDNEKYNQRKDEFAKADSVPFTNRDIKKNYYIFLNTIGRPLSENMWNKNLREIFKSAGLVVDVGVRKYNLNHRFRHGYAMYLTNVLHLSDFDVKTLMRHKNLSSTAVYHNPTPDDTEKLQEQLIQTWNISLLNEGEDIDE